MCKSMRAALNKSSFFSLLAALLTKWWRCASRWSPINNSDVLTPRRTTPVVPFRSACPGAPPFIVLLVMSGNYNPGSSRFSPPINQETEGEKNQRAWQVLWWWWMAVWNRFLQSHTPPLPGLAGEKKKGKKKGESCKFCTFGLHFLGHSTTVM